MDIILINGDVQTLDRVNTTAGAVAVRGGKIAAVGASRDIKALAGPNTKVIDLRGKTLLPGFIDAHNHMISFGVKLSQINCQDGPVDSIARMQQEIARQAGEKPAGEWITCWGYDDTKLKEKRHPTRVDLDQAAPYHPVVCLRTCGHITVANSKALELAGVTAGTPNPAGGEIVREGGVANGLLLENAQDLVKKVCPAPGADELRMAVKRAGAVFNSEGITGVHEAGAGFTFPGPCEVQAYQNALNQGDLTVRVYMMVYTDLLDELAKLGFFTGFGNDMLKIGCFKMFLDGGIGGKTAAMEDPYLGTGSRGIIYESGESLTSRMRRAHLAGFQLAVHAIGDRAINMLLEAYETILRDHPRRDHRHRIEHFTLSSPSFIDRARKLNLIPVPQAGFIYYLGESWLENLGRERVKNAFPLKKMLEAGMFPPASSDRPVTPGKPLKIIEAAVLRQTTAGRAIEPDQSVPVEQALRMYTNYAAYASFEENLKGSIEAGKLADFVVLGDSPFRVPPGEISSIPVEMTMVGGRVVYRK